MLSLEEVERRLDERGDWSPGQYETEALETARDAMRERDEARYDLENVDLWKSRYVEMLAENRLLREALRSIRHEVQTGTVHALATTALTHLPRTTAEVERVKALEARVEELEEK